MWITLVSIHSSYDFMTAKWAYRWSQNELSDKMDTSNCGEKLRGCTLCTNSSRLKLNFGGIMIVQHWCCVQFTDCVAWFLKGVFQKGIFDTLQTAKEWHFVNRLSTPNVQDNGCMGKKDKDINSQTTHSRVHGLFILKNFNVFSFGIIFKLILMLYVHMKR